MRVLGLETATSMGGVALVDEELGLLGEVRVSVKAGHAERLMAEVDHVLRAAGLGLGEVDAIAVSVGPGSFTGLRIGLATAKGLAFGSGLRVVAVPTLEAYAAVIPFCGHPIVPMLDARRGEVYAGAFVTRARDGRVEVERLLPEGLPEGSLEGPVDARMFARRVRESWGRAVFLGEGARIYHDIILEEMGAEGALFAPAYAALPLPSAVAALGIERARRGEFEDPAGLSPRYQRRSEAEIKRQCQ